MSIRRPVHRSPSLGGWLRLGRREVGILAGLLALAGLAWLLAEFVDAGLEGGADAFDRAVLLALRNPADPADPIGPSWFERMVVDLTALGGLTVLSLLSLLTVGFLLATGKRGAALLVLIAVGGGMLLNTLLKLGFDRTRPDLVGHLVETASASFPSGHALTSATTYLTLGALLTRVVARRRLKVYVISVAVLLTTAIGLSRIYLGVHWPTDVLAGWAAGSAWALLCWAAALQLQRRGKVERAGRPASERR